MIAVKLRKKNRCKSCSSDDNIIANQEYNLYIEEYPRYNHRLWLWDKKKETGFFTDVILKKYPNLIVTKNAKYEIEYE